MERAEEIANQLRNEKDIAYASQADAALVYVGLGVARKDENYLNKALDSLERAYERGDGGIDNIQFLPLYKPLHGKKRFKDLLKKCQRQVEMS